MPYPYLVGSRSIHGKFVWFEHASNSIEAARTFYEGLFGWGTEMVKTSHGEYPVIKCGQAGFGGYRTPTAPEPVHWSAYLSVEDVDSALAAALTAGASIILTAKDLGHVGRGAAILDPIGAPLYLWHGKLGDPDDSCKTPIGHWHSGLYLTPDDSALGFYERHFGWEIKQVHGTGYSWLGKDSVNRALALKASSIERAIWSPVVAIDDCSSAVEWAVAQGARRMHPVSSIPGIGTIAILMDPFGAVVTLYAAH